MMIKVFRGVAQLVERCFWEADAAGSNPVTPIRVVQRVATQPRYPSGYKDGDSKSLEP